MMRRGLFGSKTPSDSINPMAIAQMAGKAVGGATMPQAMPQPMQQPAQRPGFGTRVFGEGWEQRAAALGGLLMGDGNAVNRYHAGMQQQDMLRQQQAAAQANDMRERSLDREDWLFQQEWQRDNPTPQAPDAFERTLRGAGIDPASEQGQQMYAARAQNMTRDPSDEFVVVPIPGMGTYAGPRSGLGEAMGQGAPERPVGNLTPVPRGGTTSNSGGNFRQ